MSTPLFKSTKDPEESITVAFDVTAILTAGEEITDGSLVMTVASNVDPEPDLILLGDPVISGKRIFQNIGGGVNNDRYDIRCTFTTSGEHTYVTGGRLRVKTIVRAPA